jgi:hypothetical protein
MNGNVANWRVDLWVGEAEGLPKSSMAGQIKSYVDTHSYTLSLRCRQ